MTRSKSSSTCVTIVPATQEHVAEILADLRDHEAALRAGMDARRFERLLADEVAHSLIAYAGLLDGRCAALWGVRAPLVLSREGVVWLVGSRLVDQHPLLFLRHSRRALAGLGTMFDVLRTILVNDYAQSRRWLMWLGFDIGPDQGGICMCEYRWA